MPKTTGKKTVSFGGISTREIASSESEDSSPISSGGESEAEYDEDEDMVVEYSVSDEDGEGEDDGDANSDDDLRSGKKSGADVEDVEDFDDDDDGDDQFEQQFDPMSNDEALAQLEAQVETLAKQDEIALMNASQSAKKEKEKAKHVSRQLAAWQSALQIRLRLQKPLAMAERLPRPDMLPHFIQRRPEVKTALQNTAMAIGEVLGDLLELERGITRATPNLSSSGVENLEFTRPTLLGGGPNEGQGVKRSHPSRRTADEELEYIEKYLSSSWSAGEAQRASIIDKWSKRVSVATGKADLQTGGLKVLGQSLSKQIEQTLDVEMDRLVQRTKLRRLTTRSLGAPEPKAAEAWEDKSVRLAREVANKVDDEIFDDFDFFSVLVRELSNMDEAVDGAALANSSIYDAKSAKEALAELRKRQLIEKGVDRRASKGRKLRFAPIPKLANFMVPITNAAWIAACASGPDSAEEALTDELMLSLFGDSNVLSKQETSEREKRATERALEIMAERKKLTGDTDSTTTGGITLTSSAGHRTSKSADDDDDAVYGDFEDVEGKDDANNDDIQGGDGDDDEDDSHFAWFK